MKNYKKYTKELLFIYKDIKIAKYGGENNFSHTHKDTMFFSSTYIKNLIPTLVVHFIMIKTIGAVIIHGSYIYGKDSQNFQQTLHILFEFYKSE